MTRKKENVKCNLFWPLTHPSGIIQFTTSKLRLTYRGANKIRMNLWASASGWTLSHWKIKNRSRCNPLCPLQHSID